MNVVRLGIIGVGNMGSAHAKNVYDQKVEGMQLVAVCDSDLAKLEWVKSNLKDNVKCYENYEDLLSSGEIDAILIATPHQLHPIIAIEAFNRGLHVLIEKPAGIDTASVRKMNEIATKSGKVFGIMYNQRTNRLYQTLRDAVKAGKLGEIKRMVWIINNWYRTQAYYDSGDWRGSWNGEGGGVLLNQCPHNLDIWQWIMGMPVKVRAACKIGHFHNISVEDDATIHAEYANGASAVFITSTGEYPGTNRIEISGTKGKAVVENGTLKFYLLDQDERDICMNAKQGMPCEEVHIEIIEEKMKESGHLGILQNFTDAIRLGKSLLAPGIEGINGLMISNAAYLSSWKDEWVELPVDEENFLLFLSNKQKEEKCHKANTNKEELRGSYNERWQVRW